MRNGNEKSFPLYGKGGLVKLNTKTGTGKDFKTGCWNIRRGLLKREHEIYELLTNQELDLLFLVETDTNAIMEEKVLILTLRGTF